MSAEATSVRRIKLNIGRQKNRNAKKSISTGELEKPCGKRCESPEIQMPNSSRALMSCWLN